SLSLPLPLLFLCLGRSPVLQTLRWLRCCAWNEPLFRLSVAEPRVPARKEQQPAIISLSVTAPARCECRTHQGLHLYHHVGHVALQQVCHSGVKAKGGRGPCVPGGLLLRSQNVCECVCAPSMAGAE
ncbi:hypothetical protein DV515_00005809, partial [Chloebia gouldiae]